MRSDDQLGDSKDDCSYMRSSGQLRLNTRRPSMRTRKLLRAKVALDGSTTVEFYEKPKDIDFYDSTVVVNRQGIAPAEAIT